MANDYVLKNGDIDKNKFLEIISDAKERFANLNFMYSHSVPEELTESFVENENELRVNTGLPEVTQIDVMKPGSALRFIVHKEGEVIGSITSYVLGGSYCILNLLFVKEKYRSQGIGKWIVSEIMYYQLTEHPGICTFRTDPSTSESRSLLLSLGFKEDLRK